jgi:hypothetical protein
MMRRMAIVVACAFLAACWAAGNVQRAQGEVSEQFTVEVKRQDSQVFHAQRTKGGFYVRTGNWTWIHSPGFVFKSVDTMAAFLWMWLNGIDDIDTPEENRLIAIELGGPEIPAPVSPFPITPTYKIKTGVRDVKFSPEYETDSSDTVLARFEEWCNGHWDVDRGNEPTFIKDTMYNAP